MEFDKIIGVCASILTGCSLLPQLIKIIQEKKPGDISFIMLVILFMGLVLWTYYGLLKEDWIIVASNSFSLIINIIIFMMSSFYNRKGNI